MKLKLCKVLLLALVAILFSGIELVEQFQQRALYEWHLGEIILNLSMQAVHKMLFKDFSIFSSVGIFVCMAKQNNFLQFW